MKLERAEIVGGVDRAVSSDNNIIPHWRRCYRKEKPQNKPRPKHPPKVHVWAGISTRGAKFPDVNPIKNLWHEVKENLHAEVKPRNLAELKAGIKS